VPGGCFAAGVFEGEGEDGAALFDGGFFLRGVGLKGGVYEVEGGGGGEGVWRVWLVGYEDGECG
jgi:hypothetical protein